MSWEVIPLSLECPSRKMSPLKTPAMMISWFREELVMEVICVLMVGI